MVKFRELELNRFLTTYHPSIHPSILHGGCWFNNVSWESHANLLLSQHSLVVCSLEIHLFIFQLKTSLNDWVLAIHCVLHNTDIYIYMGCQHSSVK
jgi:hypothetical protein